MEGFQSLNNRTNKIETHIKVDQGREVTPGRCNSDMVKMVDTSVSSGSLGRK